MILSNCSITQLAPRTTESKGDVPRSLVRKVYCSHRAGKDYWRRPPRQHSSYTQLETQLRKGLEKLQTFWKFHGELFTLRGENHFSVFNRAWFQKRKFGGATISVPLQSNLSWSWHNFLERNSVCFESFSALENTISFICNPCRLVNGQFYSI